MDEQSRKRFFSSKRSVAENKRRKRQKRDSRKQHQPVHEKSNDIGPRWRRKEGRPGVWSERDS